MTTHSIGIHGATARRPTVYRLRAATGGRRQRVLRFAQDHYLLLPLGIFIALVWANVWPESYFTMSYRLAFPVNEIGMALFFALVTQEIVEATMAGGPLHHWRRWTLPVVGAAGGVAGAAMTYLAYVNWKLEPMLASGWVVAATVDLAFGYFIVKSIFRRHPAVPFLLVLAVASSVIAVLAAFPGYPVPDVGRPGGIVLMVGAIAVAVALRHRRVRALWPYLFVCGTLSWLALYLDGIHPAFALVPIVPFMPHAPRHLDLFEERPHTAHDSPHHLEHAWRHPIHVILLLFGLVNAGVLLTGYGSGTWATLVAATGGRTLGILLAVALAVAAGLHLPAHLRWRELTVVALASSGGVAFALFIATTIYPAGPLLTELKMGALLTGFGVLPALAVARFFHVGWFGRHRTS